MPEAVIYAGSHRKGGNSDMAAELVAEGVRSAGGSARILHVRAYEVLPCKACGFCDKAVGRELDSRCVLAAEDQAAELFEPLFHAAAVFFVSPIYFYHLPSRFKTWIDRSQQFWGARMNREPWIADLPARKAHTVLVAGRPVGERLFEGSQLTLKYFARNFNLVQGEQVEVRGMDAPGDLSADAEWSRTVRDMGACAWREAV